MCYISDVKLSNLFDWSSTIKPIILTFQWQEGWELCFLLCPHHTAGNQRNQPPSTAWWRWSFQSSELLDNQGSVMGSSCCFPVASPANRNGNNCKYPVWTVQLSSYCYLLSPLCKLFTIIYLKQPMFQEYRVLQIFCSYNLLLLLFLLLLLLLLLLNYCCYYFFFLFLLPY